MKTVIVAISMVTMLLLTGGMALAAPPTPAGKDHGRGVEQSQAQSQDQMQTQTEDQSQDQSGTQTQGQSQNHSQAQAHSQAQNNDESAQHGQGQDNGKGQGQDPADAKGHSQDNHQGASNAPGFDKRHGAAGTILNLPSTASNLPSGYAGSFDLQTNQGTITVLVNSGTKFSIEGKESAAFGDLKVGDRVNVNGTRDSNNDLVAKIVHVIPSKASFQHFVGTFVSYTAAGASNGSITIKDRRTGLDVTFVVTSSTKIELPQGQTAPASGDLVTIVATKDSSGYTATGVAVETPDKGND